MNGGSISCRYVCPPHLLLLPTAKCLTFPAGGGFKRVSSFEYRDPLNSLTFFLINVSRLPLHAEGPTSSQLQHVAVPVISNPECQEMYNSFYRDLIQANHICAGYAEGLKDACEVSLNCCMIRGVGNWQILLKIKIPFNKIMILDRKLNFSSSVKCKQLLRASFIKVPMQNFECLTNLMKLGTFG